MFYLDLFRGLSDCQVRYLVVGGLAMNLHGVPRMTMDVDLVLAMDDANLERFVECARKLGLRPVAPVALEQIRNPEVRRQWVEQKHMVAFALRPAAPDGPTIDILISPPLDIEQAIARADSRRVADVTVPLAAIEDMIRLKQAAGRKQDIDDIEHLRRLDGPTST